VQNIQEMTDDRPGDWRIELMGWGDNDSDTIALDRVHVETEDDASIVLYRAGAPFEVQHDGTGSVAETATVRVCTRLRQSGPLWFDDAPSIRFLATTDDGLEWMVATSRALAHAEEMTWLSQHDPNKEN